MSKSINLLVIFISVIAISCNSTASKNSTSTTTSDSTSFDIGKAKESVVAMNTQFADALKKGDSTALGAQYSSDALLCPPNMEAVSGNTAITSAWGGAINAGVRDVQLNVVDLTGNKDMLTETGKYVVNGSKTETPDKGKYIVVWKPDNGTWKRFRDIWNSDLPVPARPDVHKK